MTGLLSFKILITIPLYGKTFPLAIHPWIDMLLLCLGYCEQQRNEREYKQLSKILFSMEKYSEAGSLDCMVLIFFN